MKCVCGYEQEKDFDKYNELICVCENGIRTARVFNLYFCPKCGTVRVKQEEQK